MARPLGVKALPSGGSKLLRMGRLPEAYIASRGERELRELVRHRAKLLRCGPGSKPKCMGCWPSRASGILANATPPLEDLAVRRIFAFPSVSAGFT